MKYRWKEKYLLKGLENAIKHNDIATIQNYESMLDMIRGKDYLEFDIPEPTYDELFKNYATDMEYIEDSIFDRCSSVFNIVNNEDEIFTNLVHTRFDINNKELLQLGYEIIESIKDPKALKIYQEIIRNKNHYINIEDDTDLNDEHTSLYGVTIYDHVEKKSYIAIKRRYTIFDLSTLVHEMMHAIMYKYNDRKCYVCNYFEELEGLFGESITAQYLRKHDMAKYADEMEAYNLYLTIYQSYMLYLNDVIFFTSKDGKFNTEAATKMITEETPFKETYIDEENIPYICELPGFKMLTNIIDYMICLELRNKYTPEEQVLFIKQLRKIENYDFYNKEMTTVFDFYNDDNRQIREEKERLNKKIRVLN